jgi:YkoP domain
MDFISRKLLGIVEFDSSEDCLLRIALHRGKREIRLADGTLLHAGNVILELHLWNEHLRVPETGPDLRWAAAARRRFDRSLERLAAYVVAEPALKDVRAVMIAPALTGNQRRKNRRYMRYLLRADWTVVPRRSGFLQRVHQTIDDLWLRLLTRAFNPHNKNSGDFRRQRQEFWISRERFLSLYRPPISGKTRPEAEAALPLRQA